MTPPLLNRLRQDLPAEWQSPDDADAKGWYADAERTVYLVIGERRLFVSARPRGGLVGIIGAAQRVGSWQALRASIVEAAGRLAVDHTCDGNPIPAVPPWAEKSLRFANVRHLRMLADREAKIREDLATVAAERAWLTDLTLLTSGHLETP